MAKSRKAAKKASKKAQTESVAKLAHEFRSRLTVIQGAVDNVLAGVFGELNNEQKKNLQVALGGVERLSNLVEDFLASFSTGDGRVPIRMENISLGKLIKRSIESIEALAYREGITVEARLPRKRIDVRCDRAKVEQVFLNLFRNSIKFTPRGGSITVSARENGDEVEISVSDNGVGIPEDRLPELFSRPYPDGSKRGGDYRTSGLGLVIVGEILEAHGCDIDIESNLGEGTTFTFTLPKV